MIAFTSIFLGLILGTQTVAVVVNEEVARVEIKLDGQVRAVLEDSPWNATLDFGDKLLPRRLTATAYGAEGRELGQAYQMLNLLKAAVVSRFVAEGSADDRTVRLLWESTAGSEPKSVRIVFDGKDIEVSDYRHFRLPAHDPSQVHFLRAELDFGDNVVSTTEMTLGGGFGASVATEITAIPIVLEEHPKEPHLAPNVASLQGVFRKGDEAPRVIAVERDGAEVVMVIDESFGNELESYRIRHTDARSHAVAALQQLRFSATLPRGQRLRFLAPEAEERDGVGVHFNVFSTSPSFESTDGGVFYLMAMYDLGRQRPSEQHLSVAVAIAGQTAAGSQKPRAVVLVLGSGSRESSMIPPETTRAYLEALRVPLHVWYLKKKAPEDLSSWGQEFVRVSSLAHLDRATRKLGRELERQWIVWIEGVHLPQTIELASGVAGIRIAQ